MSNRKYMRNYFLFVHVVEVDLSKIRFFFIVRPISLGHNQYINEMRVRILGFWEIYCPITDRLAGFAHNLQYINNLKSIIQNKSNIRETAILWCLVYRFF